VLPLRTEKEETGGWETMKAVVPTTRNGHYIKIEKKKMKGRRKRKVKKKMKKKMKKKTHHGDSAGEGGETA
jgi:hypothetical protein